MTWQICVDTGGTFTDCLAVDPLGRPHRVKLLSSGVVRTRVLERPAADRLIVERRWAPGGSFLRGFRLRLVGDEEEAVEVIDHDDRTDALHLAGPVGEVRPGRTACELTTGEAAPIVASRLATATAAGQPLPPIRMRLGTTRGTNALLERRGARVVLFMTAGLGDLLEIGDQQRPDLFALNIIKRRLLHEQVVEVDERIAADGTIIAPLRDEHVEQLVEQAAALRAGGITTAAVALLNSYRRPEHERRLCRALETAGFDHVAGSAEIAPLIKLLTRAETAVVDAYLAPVVGGHLRDVTGVIGAGRLHVMTSAGGLVDARRYRACDSLLSGPAGGVTGAAAAGRASGVDRVIGFDMGGTSSDVARFDGDYDYRFEHTVGDARLVAPALAIETVAAGGGSICRVDDDRLQVGPHSAGARPGPACYGAGGPLTITDVNLLSGRLDPERFAIPIDPAASASALEQVLAALPAGTGQRPDPDAILDGLLQIANERMAGAIERISLARGYDPGEYALVAFGGAGGQHACAVAERLGMTAVIMPRHASLLSTRGLSEAVVERFAHRQVLSPLSEAAGQMEAWFDRLTETAVAAVVGEGVEAAEVQVRRRMAHLRLAGQEATLAVEWSPTQDVAVAFAGQYEAMYGHRPEGRPIEIESIRVVASTRPPDVPPPAPPAPPSSREPPRRVRARFAGRWHEVPAVDRDQLPVGAGIDGPALVLDSRSSYVIESGWCAQVDGAGALRCRRSETVAAVGPSSGGVEAVERELFTNRFRSLVEEAGEVLQRTALSVNVKERLDFSCALLDSEGGLVVNAPHIPVHLGALGACVQSVRAAIAMERGDVVVTNHPAFGGSHLPDVTVITPAFSMRPDGPLLGYVASRAHHAEIGGVRPGSMPPAATCLAEEGVVIRPTHLVRAGTPRFEIVEGLLRGGRYPSRAVTENLADLRAAVAANSRAADGLQRLGARYGDEVVAHHMARIRRQAETSVRAALEQLPRRRLHAREQLDDGSAIEVAIDLAADPPVIDFAGSAPVHPGNLNAAPAIVRSAVMYVLRVLAGQRLPLNEGILTAVDLRVPPGMLDPPFGDDPATAPAVVAGNVETSQRIVDTLLKALGLCGASQGTMNNVLFGHETLSYYETVCGGAGAGPGFDGASAVHTHMTNTRLTDPEVLEHRFPVRLERFAIRRGSGGDGKWRGGDGVVRELAFTAPMELSIVSQHRAAGPYGQAGGSAGETGRQHVVRASGQLHRLGGSDGCAVEPGDRLVLMTPGGGGYGTPPVEPTAPA